MRPRRRDRVLSLVRLAWVVVALVSTLVVLRACSLAMAADVAPKIVSGELVFASTWGPIYARVCFFLDDAADPFACADGPRTVDADGRVDGHRIVGAEPGDAVALVGPVGLPNDGERHCARAVAYNAGGVASPASDDCAVVDFRAPLAPRVLEVR